MKTEEEALKNLSLLKNGIIKNGFKITLEKALTYGHGNSDDGLYIVNKLIRDEWKLLKPPFTPDATRFKYGYIGDKDDKKIVPCVEIWEIEKTNPLTQTKLDIISEYCYFNWDGEEYPDFEVWTANSRGKGLDRVYSMYEEVYDITVNYNNA